MPITSYNNHVSHNKASATLTICRGQRELLEACVQTQTRGYHASAVAGSTWRWTSDCHTSRPTTMGTRSWPLNHTRTHTHTHTHISRIRRVLDTLLAALGECPTLSQPHWESVRHSTSRIVRRASVWTVQNGLQTTTRDLYNHQS